MNGKDLIIYILSNNLEDEPVFTNGSFVGFLTLEDVSLKMEVGVATVKAWIAQGYLDYIKIGDVYLIPANFKLTLN